MRTRNINTNRLTAHGLYVNSHQQDLPGRHIVSQIVVPVQDSDGEPSTVDEEAGTSSPLDSPRPLQRQSIDISKTFSVGEQLVELEQASTSGRLEEEPPGKRGPDDFELLRVVGKGAFGKVRHRCLYWCMQNKWVCEADSGM